MNVDNFAAVLEIVASVVPAESRARSKVAAPQNVRGLIEVDVAVHVCWHIPGGGPRRIVGNEQAHRNARGAESLSELNSGIAADRMANYRDRLGIAAIIANRLIGHASPAGMGICARRDAATIDALRQFVHAPINRGN